MRFTARPVGRTRTGTMVLIAGAQLDIDVLSHPDAARGRLSDVDTGLKRRQEM